MVLLGQSLTSGIPGDGRHGSGTLSPSDGSLSSAQVGGRQHRLRAPSAGAGWPHCLARTRATVVEIRLDQRNQWLGLSLGGVGSGARGTSQPGLALHLSPLG